MCLAPITLPSGIVTACRKCKQCRHQIVNDYVGRNIAESKTAVASNVVTLTYGKGAHGDADHERAMLLTYSDVQKYLKLLRRHGYPMRYFVAGEYGSRKGRAHWHIILYWKDKVPDHELRKNFMEPHWPHGFSFWDTVNESTAMYVCKYVLKAMGEENRQGHLACSKQPPLGTEYFRQLAVKHVEQGLAPQTLEYTFPGVTWFSRTAPMPWRFRMRGKAAHDYLTHYIAEWERRNGKREWPNSELVDLFHSYGRVILSEENLRLSEASWNGPLGLAEQPPVTEADKERRRAILNKYGEYAGATDEEWERGIWAADDAIRSIFGER